MSRESWSIRLDRYTFMRGGVTGVEFSVQAWWGSGADTTASPSFREPTQAMAVERVAWLAALMERDADKPEGAAQ